MIARFSCCFQNFEVSIHDLLESKDQNVGDPIGKACGIDSKFHKANGQTLAEGTEQETKQDSVLGSVHVGDIDEDAAINVEVERTSIERVEEEPTIRLDDPH